MDYVCSQATVTDRETSDHQQRRRLPFITELHRSRDKRHPSVQSTTFSNPLVTAEFPSDTNVSETEGKLHTGVLKSGHLHKTTEARSKIGSKPRPTGKREFRLTEAALEYLHHFSHVSHKCG